ncbi:hypothetical protein KC19_6G002600 [Ceratodon purpureus]|uniref:Hint domain-containing protein n=1 Tax=Ceratodon purpureus TaxID=3225 RepID=A0A8T0HCP9_CERPU|nr:hypothetical protein KC19_6G002600 [Ceratodon purpureus]
METLRAKQLVLLQVLILSVTLHQAAIDLIGSSLLDATTPALMFGVISSAHVSVICEQIASTGSLSFMADVTTTTLGSTITQALISSQITSTQGCMEESDASGTQALMVDDSGRPSVLVCPSNAGSIGCAIYLTGDDITNLYNQGVRRRLLGRRTLVHHMSCAGEAKKGAISGTITGVLAVTACAAFTGPMAPFCAAGMIGASAGLGAAASCASSCFPGDATVSMADGGVIQMKALALGDEVAVRKQDGRLAYEDVYAFGHKDASATATFVRLTLKSIIANMSDPAVESRSLELTALHFVPILSDVAETLVYKRAQDIIKGDKMWTQGAFMRADRTTTHFPVYVVTGISVLKKQGLYNPFTLGGTIIVNGVVASSHSDWFLDSLFQVFNLVHWLPAAYQLVLLPVRMLYYYLGKSLYITLYQTLDSLVHMISMFASKHGGGIATTVGAASGFVAILSMPKLTIKWQL